MSPATVEQLLTLPVRMERHREVDGLLTAAAGELGELLEAAGEVTWLTGLNQRAADAQERAATLEVHDRGTPLARIVLTRQQVFSEDELRLLGHVAKGLTQLLSARSETVQRRLLEELSMCLPLSASLTEVGQRALEALAGHLSAQAGALLWAGATGISKLAAFGDWPDDAESDQLALRTVREAAGDPWPQLLDNGLTVARVGTAQPVRWLLVLHFGNGEGRLPGNLPALAQAARVLEPYLSGRWRTEVLAELLDLHGDLTDTPTEEAYELILQAAIRLVPGADSGSLLARRHARERYVFQAAHGFDLEVLRASNLPDSQVRGWYGPDEEGWRQGRPRLLRRDIHDIEAFGVESTPDLSVPAAAYDNIQASLCLPVARDGEVMAMLNLENQSDPAAFGEDSLEIAHMFGPPLASLLNQRHVNDLLRHAALVDELTGLYNRRSFDESLKRELARRVRGAGNVTVLLMDLKDFKRINDTFGHEAGDRALELVAQALRNTLRQSDLLSRWGGDEFAAILVDTPDTEVTAAIERVRQAVRDVSLNGQQLDIQIGRATSPAEGNSPEKLLRVADQRMYREKHGATEDPALFD